MNHRRAAPRRQADQPKPAPGAGPEAEQVFFSLLHAAYALESRLESALGEVGLSSAKLSVLSELVKARQPLPLRELAARLSCVRSNITQLVDRLEADRLVRRLDDPSDRRSVLAMVTPLGKEKQSAGAVRLKEVQQAFAQSLSTADQGALQRVRSALE